MSFGGGGLTRACAGTGKGRACFLNYFFHQIYDLPVSPNMKKYVDMRNLNEYFITELQNRCCWCDQWRHQRVRGSDCPGWHHPVGGSDTLMKLNFFAAEFTKNTRLQMTTLEDSVVVVMTRRYLKRSITFQRMMTEKRLSVFLRKINRDDTFSCRTGWHQPWWRHWLWLDNMPDYILNV